MGLGEEDFLAHGLASNKAKAISGKIDVKDFCNKQKLRSYGLDSADIERLNRPAIPPATVKDLLFKSKMICCVCRTPNSPFIIHHIIEWADSHSHNPENLAVLCLNCHDLAHTDKHLSQNLTPAKIRHCRHGWFKIVADSDRKTAAGIISSDNINWDFFNYGKFFQIAKKLDITFRNIDPRYKKLFDWLTTFQYIEPDGSLVVLPSSWLSDNKMNYYWLDFSTGIQIWAYVCVIMDIFIKSTKLKIIDNTITRTKFLSDFSDGDYVIIDASTSIKKIGKVNKGLGQTKKATIKLKDITIEFEFDGWYATSNSSRTQHLSGTKKKIILASISNIRSTQNKVIVECSVVAIGWKQNALLKKVFGEDV